MPFGAFSYVVIMVMCLTSVIWFTNVMYRRKITGVADLELLWTVSVITGPIPFFGLVTNSVCLYDLCFADV
jgi:hypothetical protein